MPVTLHTQCDMPVTAHSQPHHSTAQHKHNYSRSIAHTAERRIAHCFAGDCCLKPGSNESVDLFLHCDRSLADLLKEAPHLMTTLNASADSTTLSHCWHTRGVAELGWAQLDQRHQMPAGRPLFSTRGRASVGAHAGPMKCAAMQRSLVRKFCVISVTDSELVLEHRIAEGEQCFSISANTCALMAVSSTMASKMMDAFATASGIVLANRASPRCPCPAGRPLSCRNEHNLFAASTAAGPDCAFVSKSVTL